MSTIGNSEVAVSLCERQFELGEGPAVAALAADVPVLEEDLTSAAARVRAPVLTAEAAALGAVAMFAFPLRVVGTLDDPTAIPTGGGPSGRTALGLIAFVVLALTGSTTLLVWSRGG